MVEPGEEVTISLLISNIGEEPGPRIFTLNVEGEPFTIEVTLAGGESETRRARDLCRGEVHYMIFGYLNGGG